MEELTRKKSTKKLKDKKSDLDHRKDKHKKHKVKAKERMEELVSSPIQSPPDTQGISTSMSTHDNLETVSQSQCNIVKQSTKDIPALSIVQQGHLQQPIILPQQTVQEEDSAISFSPPILSRSSSISNTSEVFQPTNTSFILDQALDILQSEETHGHVLGDIYREYTNISSAVNSVSTDNRSFHILYYYLTTLN